MSVITPSNPPGVHDTGGRYTHAMLVEGARRRLVISGQVGIAPDGAILDGPEAQIPQALANLGTILKAHDMGPSDVVKTTAFLTYRAHIPVLREARRTFFGEHVSASTLLIVSGLADPKFVFEIEAEAVA